MHHVKTTCVVLRLGTYRLKHRSPIKVYAHHLRVLPIDLNETWVQIGVPKSRAGFRRPKYGYICMLNTPSLLRQLFRNYLKI